MLNTPPLLDRITTSPHVCAGQPHIIGTGLAALRVAELASAYPSYEALRRDYPELDEEDIRQALCYQSMGVVDRLAYADPASLLELLCV